MTSQDLRIEYLLADYNNARDDERYFANWQANLLSIGLAVLAALFVVLKDLAASYPDALMAAMPLIVLSFLAFAEYAGAQASLRSFYMRALERELRQTLSRSDCILRSAGLTEERNSSLQLLSFSEFQANYSSMSSSRSFGYFMKTIVFGALSVVFGGICIFLSVQVSLSWRILMWLFYAPVVGIILVDNYQSTNRGRSFFRWHRREVTARLEQPLEPYANQRTGRSLLSYLILPRPDDLLTKCIFTIAGAGLGTLALDPAHRQSLFTLGLLFFAVELLCYQARYQWNDVRGAEEDARAPSSLGRGRLPGGRKNTSLSLAVMGVRLSLVGWVWAVVAELSPSSEPVLEAVKWSVPTVFGLAVAYEMVREWIRRSGCSGSRLVLLLVLVSLGYPLRFFLGWTASGSPREPLPIIVVCISLSLLGVVFVAPTWVLEAMSYVTHQNVSKRGVVYYAGEALDDKDHLRQTAKWSGLKICVGVGAGRALDGAKETPLKDRSRVPGPWNIAGAGWLALIAPGFCGLVTGERVSWSLLLLVGPIVAILPLRGRYGSGALSLFAGAIVVAVSCWTLPITRGAPLWVCLASTALLFVPCILMLAFRGLSYHTSREVARQIGGVAAGGAAAMYRLFVGSQVSRKPETIDSAIR